MMLCASNIFHQSRILLLCYAGILILSLTRMAPLGFLHTDLSIMLMQAILFLKENHELWSIHDVFTALKKLKENEKSARFETRLAALNLEQTQNRADMEMLNVRDDE